MTHDARSDTAALLAAGGAYLGVELGSTTIKACVVSPSGEPLATGRHLWENEYVDGRWTYSLEAVWRGVQDCYASVLDDVDKSYGVRPTSYAGIGISAMMHGYLVFDEFDELLVPFRTWRNTSTGPAATRLSSELGCNIPLRWSVAHLYQAVLDKEPHIASAAWITTLAGYVHRQLTGRHVLGVGDASGMFPIDSATGTYDEVRMRRFDELVAGSALRTPLRDLLPEALPAGARAGTLTPRGAARLDVSGLLEAGVPLCPPEGDAGTGMVATNSIAPGSANVSVGTSIFAMVVLEHELDSVHDELDLVTTPAGDPVAMVHCNNGASELQAWADVFGEFANALGRDAAPDDVFRALLERAMVAESDAGGLLAYNYLSGEPITGLEAGRPLLTRGPDSRFTLANLMRAQVYSAFATLSLGMRVLVDEGVRIDLMYAHGGLFRTEGVAQRLLAAAIDSPVAVGTTPGEGGAWGIALLAAYTGQAQSCTLSEFLGEQVFSGARLSVVRPDRDDVRGYTDFLDRYVAALPVQRAAADTV